MSTEPIPISVIVVSYNTAELLARCLEKLSGHLDVIVVDNASQDDSVSRVKNEFPTVRLIENTTNRGFAAANNQGLSLAKHPIRCLLNSDALELDDALQSMAQFLLQTPNAIACGPRLLNPDGSLQLSSAKSLSLWSVFCEQTYLERLLRHSRKLAPFWNSQFATGPMKTDQVMGACLMMNSKLQLDERFFLYCEDSDLCERLRAEGDIWYVPQAQVVHELGASSSQNRWLSIARYNAGKELYFSIHHTTFAVAACFVLNRLGALLRLFLGALSILVSTTKGMERVRTFAKVLFAPMRP